MLTVKGIVNLLKNGNVGGATEALIELAEEVAGIDVDAFRENEQARDKGLEVIDTLQRVITIIDNKYKHIREELNRELTKELKEGFVYEDKITVDAINYLLSQINNNSDELGLSGDIDEGKEAEGDYV